MAQQLRKQTDFFAKAKKEYQKAAKPILYEFHLTASTPQPRKFLLIVNQFVGIFKDGMKEAYGIDDELKSNYWNQLEKHFMDSYEMSYITNIYDKKINNLRLYFALLIHNHTIFDTIYRIAQELPFLYVDPEAKLKKLPEDLEPMSFLKDGQYVVSGDKIRDFGAYCDKKKEEESIAVLKAAREKEEKEARLKEQAEKKRLNELQQMENARQKELMREAQRAKEILEKNGQPNLRLPSVVIPQKYVSRTNMQVKPPPSPRPEQTKYLKQEWKGKEKQSQILLRQQFIDELGVFSFREKPTVSEDKSKCFQCKTPLSQGIFYFGGNCNFCHYSGQWYCNDHIAEQRCPIPWKAYEQFDLRGYSVSRVSLNQIKSYYEKPLIELHNNDPVVLKNPKLFDFLVLRKQIHLMYDSICNCEVFQKLLPRKLNYCLKRHLLSLKNLYDIYNGHQGPSLQREYDIICKHFYKCQICQKKKGYICGKCKNPPKIFPFELRITHGCKFCRKLYHRNCLINNQCDCNHD